MFIEFILQNNTAILIGQRFSTFSRPMRFCIIDMGMHRTKHTEYEMTDRWGVYRCRLETEYEEDPLADMFNVYLQIFLSCALEQGFLTAILDSKGEYIHLQTAKR